MISKFHNILSNIPNKTDSYILKHTLKNDYFLPVLLLF